jgi:protein SCO1/2
MSRKGWIYTGFFAALVLVFYFVLTKVIPGFTKKKLEPISYVRPFSFTNQDGKTITEKDVAGKVYAVEFFFTTCQTVCPIMNDNMKIVYEKLKDQNDFLILSHTSMPVVDSVPQLKHFSDSLGVNTSRWIFLTGRKDSLYNAARVSYTLDDPSNNVLSVEDQFIHTQFWALVDRNGDVRKIYDGLKTSEAELLIKDARKLLKEK